MSNNLYFNETIEICKSHKDTFIIFLFQCRVLLNLRTSQPFEEVLDDLGQVLKMQGTKKMYTANGHDVRFHNK